MAGSYQIQYFLGANSPRGFYSLYSELLPPETANAIYIIKGGPGCGKSTLMRQVGAQAAQAGETVEYILCSGDPGSLDGVVLPRLKVALVDGTAPHVIEPKYPGMVEQYVNLGVCYDRVGLQEVREELQNCMVGYKEHSQRAYRCLGAAAEIREDVRDTLMTEELEAKLAKRARGILSRELKPRKTGEAGAVKQRVFIPLKSQRGAFEKASASRIGPVDKPEAAENAGDFFRRMKQKTRTSLCGLTSIFVKYAGRKRPCFQGAALSTAPPIGRKLSVTLRGERMQRRKSWLTAEYLRSGGRAGDAGERPFRAPWEGRR